MNTFENCILRCGFDLIFCLSGLINKCSEIYEDSECVRDVVDTTNYICDYSCRVCSGKREEPMEKTWISTNSIDLSSNIFIENCIILDNFEISQFHEYFSGCKPKNTDLVILKSIDKRESYYLCTKSFKYYQLEFSSIRFLSVTYKNADGVCIPLGIDKEWLVVGNEILGYIHVLRMLEHQNEPFVFNMDYVLEIIDSNINVFELKKNQYLKIEKEGYLVETETIF